MSLDLLIVPDEIASGIYEIRKIFDHIVSIRGEFSYDVVIDRNVSEKILNKSKCVLFFRSRSVLHYQLALLCKKLNKPVFLFIDDDFLGLADNYGINGAGIWKGRKDALKKMLPLMDAIISPNDLLNEKYAGIGNVKRRVRIDTSVDLDTLVKKSVIDKGRIVLYINDGSIDMFNKYLRPALKKIGELRPDTFQVDLLSLHPDCSDINGVTFNFIPHMTYPQFRTFMNESPFALGMAPLDNDGFNQYKYFNKYIEYTRSGILGIYSDCPLYRQVVKNYVNGLLVDNSADAWVRAILFCYDHPMERAACLERAQSIISNQFNKDNICDGLIKNLPELFKEDKSKKVRGVDVACIKFIYYLSRVEERIYLFCRYFRIGGLKTVILALKHRRERNKEKIK